MTEPAPGNPRPRPPATTTPPGTPRTGTPAAHTPDRTGGRPPRTILHLALATDWHKARAHGEYRVSTIGRTLDQEGFIHASADTTQLHGVAARYYAGITEPLLVLTIDTALLPAPVRLEIPDGATEAFPHVYGPIPVTAVVRAAPYRRPA